MACLHLIFSQAGAISCLEVAAEADTLLLIVDGVYLALTETGIPMLAIAADVNSRGLASRITNNLRLIDYPEMVDQVAGHTPVISWH